MQLNIAHYKILEIEFMIKRSLDLIFVFQNYLWSHSKKGKHFL